MESLETNMQSRSNWMSYRPAILGLLCIGIGAKITHSLLYPTTFYCGKAPDPTFGYVVSALLAGYGIWNVWQSVAHRATWTEQTLRVRNRIGQTKTVQFADLTLIEYEPNYTLYIFGDSSVKVFDWMSGARKISETFKTVTRTHAPHLGYIPAFRGALEEAETAGCLRCETLCAPSDVKDWNLETEAEEDELDLGACPTCETTEGLMFGVDGHVVTPEGLQMWNKLLLDSLDGEEKESRMAELAEGRRRAALSPSFS